MTQSNVELLAAMERESGDSNRSSAEILDEVASLGEQPDLGQLEALTMDLGRALRDSSPLQSNATREQFIALLHRKISSPARFFDSAIESARLEEGKDTRTNQGRSVTFENPEPWPEPVDGADLLHDIVLGLRKYIVIEEDQLVIVALWAIHTFVFDAMPITPRLAITSPEKRCGKTLLLILIKLLVSKPLMSANASPAVIFRCLDKFQPTLLVDEADTFLHGKDELRGILNSGHQRDGCVLRTVGESYEPAQFMTFAPLAIAMIGKLPDTLDDRSIAVRTARKRPGDKVERFRQAQANPFENLRRRAVRWAADHHEAIALSDPMVPDVLNDRAADNWRILLAIADAAGGDWKSKARIAASSTGSSSSGEDLSHRVRLLRDIRDFFADGSDRVFSQQLVTTLVDLEESPWSEWKAGRSLTTRQLAQMLKPFDIGPRQIRIDAKSAKGYLAADFEEAFLRYLSDTNRNNRNTPLESDSYSDSSCETSLVSVSDRQRAENVENTRVVSDVSDVSDETGGAVESLSAEGREVYEL